MPRNLLELRRDIKAGKYDDDRYDPAAKRVLFLAWLYDYGQIGDMPPSSWVYWREPERWTRTDTGRWKYRFPLRRAPLEQKRA